MPQSNYLPMFTASYPLLAKTQKPGGVTVLTTVAAGDVPNKPTYVAGTIQSVETLAALTEEQEAAAQEAAEGRLSRQQALERQAVSQEAEDVEEEVEEDDGNGGTVKRKRTVTRTRTTTRHRR